MSVDQRRFVIFDRDGTVITEKNYLSTPEQVELIPGVARGMRKLCEIGFGLVLVTNQSGLGRGFFDRNRLQAIHERLRELLGEENVYLDGIYVCPHVAEDKCSCRKPKTGLLELAAKELGFEPSASYVIGDKKCDIELGKGVGATTFLVLTGYGKQTNDKGQISPDYVVENVFQAANVIARLLASKI